MTFPTIARFVRVAAVCAVAATATVQAQTPADTGSALMAPKVGPLQAPGIDNLFRATDRILSGGQPEGDEAFASLRKLGVKTIISVDGIRPDLERAAKFHLRYVHLPHGYDGIPPETAARLVKAARTLEGPIFVHCHHGKHRGPAAVGVICQATAGWTPDQAVAWMKQAGTSPDYAGLYRANADFLMPTAEALARVPEAFPSHAEVSGLVDAMVAIDLRWDQLKAAQKAGWRVPPDQPDLIPAAEALLLQEAYRELQRDVRAQAKGETFLGLLREAESGAKDLHALLGSRATALDEAALRQADALSRAAGGACAGCHKKFRN
jgi:protein tyrosine phosphatase (PTP) superfamily phosphohydrolase (DUF442 family)